MCNSKVRGSINTLERVYFHNFPVYSGALRTKESLSTLTSPISVPHLLHTQSTHIVNCILYLVSVSLLSVKCKVNTRYFTQICQVFAQRVWARHTRGEGRRAGLDWAGLFGVAQSAAQCNGIYCNLNFNAQMSFLYALNVN